MRRPELWLFETGGGVEAPSSGGLVRVHGFRKLHLPPEQYLILEKAEFYEAEAVFFEAPQNGAPPVAQAFIYVSDGPEKDPAFGKLHRQLWSWGGVPLVYRQTSGCIQLFRCAHGPDFETKKSEEPEFKPYATLSKAADIDKAIKNAPWWNVERLQNGTLWDDPAVSKQLLSERKAAHKALIASIGALNDDLIRKKVLRKELRRKLLILSLLIAYLEAREVLVPKDFEKCLSGASKFFEVLTNGPALVKLLAILEERFNGNVFTLEDAERDALLAHEDLHIFARLIEGQQLSDGQMTLWQRYSFRDLPVGLISHIYQLFVVNAGSSVYTPPFLVHLMLDEAMSWKRLDWLEKMNGVVLDPSCGSGVFLVEAFKRLVVHWRKQNGWAKPDVATLRKLLGKIHGIDLEQGAAELAAFSLCLALCDFLGTDEIRESAKLFPALLGRTIHTSCFFEAKEKALLKETVGIVVGNPPFDSKLTTDGAKRAYERYGNEQGDLPDTQLGYLFLHEAMECVAPGGVMVMLQQYNFLYNQQSRDFRQRFFRRWDVREVLDFISLRGLFAGRADTKVIAVVAEANEPPADRLILHATFRRSARAEAQRGFDIDYYDLHQVPRDLALVNDGIWRSNLLGGGRVLGFVDRLKGFKNLGDFAADQKWDFGEGFIEGKSGKRPKADHITGKKCFPSRALTLEGLDVNQIFTETATHFKSRYTASRFTPPMLLIREHMDLPFVLWEKHYLTYRHKIVGLCAPPEDAGKIRELGQSFAENRRALTAFTACSSYSLFTQRAINIGLDDIKVLPCPESGDLDLSVNERILVDDIVDHYRDLIRRGEKSRAMREHASDALVAFNAVFTGQINAIYRKKPLRALQSYSFQGILCQPFVFGKGKVDWNGADELKDKLDDLLKEQRGTSLHITRIARIYDGAAIYLLKPDRLRYWLRSAALRDSDEALADLADQGF